MATVTPSQADAKVTAGQTDLAKEVYGPIIGNRLVQLAAGFISMVVISNYQYAFTLFTPGLRQQFVGTP